MFRRSILFPAALLAFFLSGCDSAEERAERHFLKSVELFQTGDVARAIVELRNVFKLDGAHRDARILMAEIEEERGNARGAYAQYIALTENTPGDFEARRAAARLAAELGDWEAAERHVDAGKALLTDGETDPVIHAVALGIAYRKARKALDPEAARSVAAEAAAILEADPGQTLARRILIDDHLVREDWEGALAALEDGLAQSPDDRMLYNLRLGVLERLGRPEAIEAQLRDMIVRFTEDESLPGTLVRWYLSQNRLEDAEAFLRTRIDPADVDPEARMTLVAFLSQIHGPEVALQETVRILDETGADDPNRSLYRAAQAGLIFDTGDQDAAIAEMQAILDGALPREQRQRIKITLARMLAQSDNPVGARALIEEVLAEDPTEVDALKMRAAWMIEDDRPDAALVELRRALDQAPRDPGILTLMAQAQERAGSRDLMGEMLALAVEASGGGVAESLRYATFLAQEDRLLPAEGVLIGALRRQPGDLQLLDALGNVYVRLEDWGRAEGVAEALARLDSADAGALADRLTARILAAQNRRQELQEFLEKMAAGQDGNNRAVASAIRLRLAEGDVEGALAYLQKQLAEDPEDPDLQLISAALSAMEGRTDEALVIVKRLVEDTPQDERLWISLYNLYRTTGDLKQARAVLSEALETVPDSPNLHWARAGELERQGDFEGAIEIYEDLYERNSNSAVMANNLASLISSFREDEESLQRAFAIARRLRGTEIPQFQDTYGWIAARLGNHEEALEYLEPAAKALPEDPTVQYHLARTYAMAGRNADALEAYRDAMERLESAGRPLPFRDEIAAEIVRLENATAPAEN